jgi:hypothetical protein
MKRLSKLFVRNSAEFSLIGVLALVLGMAAA